MLILKDQDFLGEANCVLSEVSYLPDVSCFLTRVYSVESINVNNLYGWLSVVDFLLC